MRYNVEDSIINCKFNMTLSLKALNTCQKIGEGMIEAMDLSAKLSMRATEDMIHVEVEGEDQTELIGYHGETLGAFQTLLGFMVSQKIGERVSVLVDVDGYREKQKKTLANIALKAAHNVRENNLPVSLEPMTPYERRIVHLILQEEQGITTESQGGEPHRKVVILPAQENAAAAS